MKNDADYILSNEKIQFAQDLIYKTMPPSPQYSWPLLNQELGAEVWVKHENHNPTGSFKVRGGIVYIHNLIKNCANHSKIMTATRGNHGQSIAFAASKFGIKPEIFVPLNNCEDKNNAMIGLGANLQKFGENFDVTRHECANLAQMNDFNFIPSFHHDLVCGVATYGIELMSKINDIDKIYVPIGLGSGICATILVRDLLGLKTKIIGVVSQAADAYAQSLEANKIINTKVSNTFADGIAVGAPNQDAFNIIKNGVEEIIRVNDDEIANAIRLYFSHTHNIAEGAGAAALAAAIKQKSINKNKKIALILSGGNIEKNKYIQTLSGYTPYI